MSGSDVYYLLKHSKRLERPSHCPLFIYEIMIQCWEWDEKKRPTFYQLFQLLNNNFDSPHIKQKSILIDNDINHLNNNDEQNNINHQLKPMEHF